MSLAGVASTSSGGVGGGSSMATSLSSGKSWSAGGLLSASRLRLVLSSLNRLVLQHCFFEHFFFRYALLNNGWSAISKPTCPDRLTHPRGLAKLIDLTFLCQTDQQHRIWLWIFLGLFFVLKPHTWLAWMRRGARPQGSGALVDIQQQILRVAWVIVTVFLTMFYLLYCTAKFSSGVLIHSTNLNAMAMLAYMFVHLYFAAVDLTLWWRHRSAASSASSLLAASPARHRLEGRDVTYDDDISAAVLHQIIACGYFLSAITKVMNSGTWWGDINQVVYIAKANAQKLNDVGTENHFADWFIQFSLEHPYFISVAFLGAFAIEVASLTVFVWNRGLLFLGGISLRLLHLGILILMRIDLNGFKKLDDAYFLNLPYWVALICLKLREYSTGKPSRLRATLDMSDIDESKGDQNDPWEENSKDHSTPPLSNVSTASCSSFWSNLFSKRNSLTMLLGKKRRVRCFEHFPLWPAVVMIALCLYFGETYPFTPFGMYSAPHGDNFYFNLTDANDVTLSSMDVLGVSAGKFKKLGHSTKFKGLLPYFIQNAPPDTVIRNDPRSLAWPLKLWKMRLSLVNNNGKYEIVWPRPKLMEVTNLTAIEPQLETVMLYPLGHGEEYEDVTESKPTPKPKKTMTKEERIRKEDGAIREE